MTDKEKIRKEVERLMTELIQEKKKGYSSDVDDACVLELQNVLTYIDSLQKEPVSNDLEAEFVLYLKHKFNIPQEGNTLKTNGWNPSPYDILDIAKHFAQWQKEQILGDDNKQYHRLRHDTLKRLYENEAKLELMLDRALEGYIEKYEQIGGHNYLSLKIPMLSKPDNCKDGDKIKLIILKEK